MVRNTRRRERLIAREMPVTAEPGSELWLGDIPKPYWSMKKMRAILYSNSPFGVVQPFLRRVSPRAYKRVPEEPKKSQRVDENEVIEYSQINQSNAAAAPACIDTMLLKSNVCDDMSACLISESCCQSTATELEVLQSQNPASIKSDSVSELENEIFDTNFLDDDDENEETKECNSVKPLKKRKIWYGYAFVVYRDKREADLVVEQLNGCELAPGFVARFQPSNSIDTASKEILSVHCNPPLHQQVAPISRADVLQRLIQFSPTLSTQLAAMSPYEQREALITHYIQNPREEIHSQGLLLPKSILTCLLYVLENLRWPPCLQRRRVDSHHYIVLKNCDMDLLDSTSPHHKETDVDQYHLADEQPWPRLRELAHSALRFASASFSYSAIAVTKNFSGSPHIDHIDVTTQYALSLGAFEGGELCVESEVEGRIHVVSTRDRIAHVDGRYVHWVRGREGGDRYSLIFYSTKTESATSRKQAVFALQ